MSAYKRKHVNIYFLNQEKGLYVDIRARNIREKHEKCRNYVLLKKQKTCMMLKFSHDEQWHENEQTSLIMNLHVDYGVEKSLIQLGYKNRRDTHLQLSFFANLLISCMPCLGSPHLMYHIFNLYRGLPFPSPAVLVVSEAALGFWRATLSSGGNTWIDWASE